jgi:hypothetical protein
METVCMAMSDWVFIIWGPLSTFWFKKGALEYISENLSGICGIVM